MEKGDGEGRNGHSGYTTPESIRWAKKTAIDRECGGGGIRIKRPGSERKEE